MSQGDVIKERPLAINSSSEKERSFSREISRKFMFKL